jgi:hypothetical protein
MRRPAQLVLGLLVLMFCTEALGQTTIGDRKTAADGVTKGWLIEYPNPDPVQEWRRVAGTLIIARHGRIIRRIEAGPTTFWSWNFWDGGRRVAYQMGPLHGETVCTLTDVRSGKEVAHWSSDCRNRPEDAPAWVKAADGSVIK